MKDEVWEEARGVKPTIQIQKFSASTAPRDVTALDLPEEMRDELDHTNVGQVWRARVGRAKRWSYGWSAGDALKRAIKAYKL